MAEPARGRRPVKNRRGARYWVPRILVALTLPFVVGYFLAILVLFPKQRVQTDGIEVPSLTGMTIVEAERALAQVGLGRLEYAEQPSPDAPVGTIIAQSPLAGQQLHRGDNVRGAISSGPSQVRVPDVIGLDGPQAEQMLRILGFTVTRADGPSDLPAGRVFAVEPRGGELVRLPATLTLRVSNGPPVDTLAVDSLLLDTLADTIPPPRR